MFILVAKKEFQIWEGPTENGYRITIYDGDRIFDEFIRPTQIEALNACEEAGYERMLRFAPVK